MNPRVRRLLVLVLGLLVVVFGGARLFELIQTSMLDTGFLPVGRAVAIEPPSVEVLELRTGDLLAESNEFKPGRDPFRFGPAPRPAPVGVRPKERLLGLRVSVGCRARVGGLPRRRWWRPVVRLCRSPRLRWVRPINGRSGPRPPTSRRRKEASRRTQGARQPRAHAAAGRDGHSSGLARRGHSPARSCRASFRWIRRRGRHWRRPVLLRGGWASLLALLRMAIYLFVLIVVWPIRESLREYAAARRVGAG